MSPLFRKKLFLGKASNNFAASSSISSRHRPPKKAAKDSSSRRPFHRAFTPFQTISMFGGKPCRPIAMQDGSWERSPLPIQKCCK